MVKLGHNIKLAHATYHSKLGSIKRLGLRVSKRTTRGTAFSSLDAFSDIRARAYRSSEWTLEDIRKQFFPDQPSRVGAVFFYLADQCLFFTEPGHTNFGYGKDVLLLVDGSGLDRSRVAIGDMEKSDEVFSWYMDEYEGRLTATHNMDDPGELAKEFWESVEMLDASDISQYQDSEEFGLPEVWYRGVVPPSAILEIFGPDNPIQDTTLLALAAGHCLM